MEEPRSVAAERFMRGVYFGDVAVVEELAAPDIVITYPAFEQLFNSTAVRGREQVKEFSNRFSRRWGEAELVVHRNICQGNNVVLVWDFSARNTGSVAPDQSPTNERSTWGGITLFEFNEEGQVVAEIGEESAPGPIRRAENARAS